MGKWFKNILGLVIVAFLLWYLVGHRQQLKVLLRLGPEQFVVLYSLYFLSTLVSARVVQCLVSALKTKTKFWDMVWLQNTAILLNYLPMKFGTLFRANYLKRHYGLAYSHFASFFLYVTFLMTATSTALGLVILAAVYGLAGYESKILAGVFAGTITASVILLFVPLPEPKGKGSLSTALRNFLTGRKQIAKARKTIVATVAFLAVNFLVTACRLAIIYHSMGKDIHPAGYLILGALGFVILFISLTPGSLGIREFVLGIGAVALGVPLEVGVLAAVVDRAISMSYIFVVGGGCALSLWRKSPADFKEQQGNFTDQ
jgi:uncharacterized membrane protein YbhN (UPF0104 family)